MSDQRFTFQLLQICRRNKQDEILHRAHEGLTCPDCNISHFAPPHFDTVELSLVRSTAGSAE